MTVVGVPLMAPVDESNAKPAGSDGETDHDVIVPPLEVGVAVVSSSDARHDVVECQDDVVFQVTRLFVGVLRAGDALNDAVRDGGLCGLTDGDGCYRGAHDGARGVGFLAAAAMGVDVVVDK